MTDNEIIKALECCAQIQRRCAECPAWKELNLCGSVAKSQALKLINRQKSEIESLGESVRLQSEMLYDLEMEIERLKGILDSYALQYGTATDKEVFLKQAKAEAFKEFADGLHKYIDDFREKREMVMLPYTEAALLAIEKKIDNLVKEFTEETK